VHSDVIGLVAFDFVLRVVATRVMPVSLVAEISLVDFDDPTGHVSGFRVPPYAITEPEFHDELKRTKAVKAMATPAGVISNVPKLHN
jgi:hypothetical protein